MAETKETTKKTTKRTSKKLTYKEVIALKGEWLKAKLEESSKDEPKYDKVKAIRKEIARALTKLNQEKK